MPGPSSRALIAALLFLLVPAASVTAELYQWTDSKGETHFAQGLDSVPPRYRDKARMLGNVDPPRGAAQSPAARDGEGVATFSFTPGRPIVVGAKINGQGLVRLILDTGADATVISSATLVALRVSYRDARPIPLRGIGGSTTGYAVMLDSLEMGGARVAPMRVISHDVELEPGVAGLLGRDFLSYFRVSIDHARGTVELAPK